MKGNYLKLKKKDLIPLEKDLILFRDDLIIFQTVGLTFSNFQNIICARYLESALDFAKNFLLSLKVASKVQRFYFYVS